MSHIYITSVFLLLAFAEYEAYGGSFKAEGLAELLFQIALVGEMHERFVVDEHYEGGGLHALLGGVIDAQAAAAGCRGLQGCLGVGENIVQQAGGYGFRTKKSKSYVIYLNGTVKKARRWSKGVIEPGCEIVIPEKREKENNLENVLAISTTAASLGTMIATIGNILR